MTRHYSDSDVGDGFATPWWIVYPLAEALGGFDLDPASGAEPEPCAHDRYTENDDGLAQEWYGDVWLNPPYGRQANPQWAEKVTEEFEAGNVETITALVPAATSTRWWSEHYGKADILTFISHRIRYIGEDDTATFGNVIASFGDFPDSYISALEDMRADESKPKPTILVSRDRQ